MKKHITLILISIFFFFTAFKSTEWITYNSTEGKFSISLPSEPQSSEQKATEGPGAPYTVKLLISKEETVVYIVGWVDYNPDFRFDNQVELESNRDNFISGVDATLTETKNITWENHPGIYFTAKGNNDGYLWTSRVFIIGKRPYQLVMGQPAGTSSPNENRFFSTFKLTK